jgi:CheY-like chemotaxis protein
MSPSTERKHGPAPGRPPTILIVEDEVLMRLVLADYLRSCGYRVVEANTADEAVTILSKTDETVDIVFSDVQMPGTMDGFALARWLRREHPDMALRSHPSRCLSLTTANALTPFSMQFFPRARSNARVIKEARTRSIATQLNNSRME